jgi:hypothetical protein
LGTVVPLAWLAGSLPRSRPFWNFEGAQANDRKDLKDAEFLAKVGRWTGLWVRFTCRRTGLSADDPREVPTAVASGRNRPGLTRMAKA